jgi:hypothetical protein
VSSDDKKSKTSTYALVVAGIAMVTTVGEAVTSYYQHQADVAASAESEQDRVKVDNSTQEQIAQALDEVYAELDECRAITESHDRELYEMRFEVDFMLNMATGSSDVPMVPEPPPPRPAEAEKKKRKKLSFDKPRPIYQMEQRLMEGGQ